MNIEAFLDRLIPPEGNYLCLTWRMPDRDIMGQRMVPRSDIVAAGGLARWAVAKGADVYFALAAFTLAESIKVDQFGRTHFKGKRTQENAAYVKAFWIDVDIQRPGGNKPGCFADLTAAATWFAGFLHHTGLPVPNLRLNSGVGRHFYWVLEQSMTAAEWQPYATALKAALIKFGFTGDAMVSADRARILRIPESFNCKDPKNKLPVYVIAGKTQVEYPNEVILSKLRPFLSLTTKGPSRPSGTAASVSPLNRAGQANVPQPGGIDYKLADVLPYCQQLRDAVATGGATLTRNRWQLGDLNTLAYCSDGEDYVHPISQGWPGYVAEQVDAAWAQTLKDKDAGKFGPTLCEKFDEYTPGVCPTCPLWGRIKIPLQARADFDMPLHYRRNKGYIERQNIADAAWVRILRGDIDEVHLGEVEGVYEIRFVYRFPTKPHHVRVSQDTLKFDAAGAHALWAGRGLQVDFGSAREVSVLMNAWIEQLRAIEAGSTEKLQPFGWIEDKGGEITGLAVGGHIYRTDGSRDFIPIPDAQLAEWYAPRGEVDTWKGACAFTCKNRIESQAIVACSFGAPLMRLTGQGGVTLSFWSPNSGVGKSAAVAIGQTVWGSLKAVSYRSDSEGAKRVKLAAAQFLPQYQDELQLDDANARAAVSSLYDVAQGAGRARLRPDATLRPAETWASISILTSNAPVLDHVMAFKNFTDAGAVRLFEAKIERATGLHDPVAQTRIMDATRAWGTAGSIYAEYIIKNLSSVQALQQKLAGWITAETQAQDAERFYVAGISCVLAGAAIARGLGLYDFQVKPMWAYFKNAWMDLRRSRIGNAPLAQREVKAEDIFDQFMDDMQLNRLILSQFRARGSVDPNYMRYQSPGPNRTLIVQISCAEAEAWIGRKEFVGWCRKNNFSGDELIKRFTIELGASIMRHTLGSGTAWEGGRIPVLVVPLKGPLAHYADAPKKGKAEMHPESREGAVPDSRED